MKNMFYSLRKFMKVRVCQKVAISRPTQRWSSVPKVVGEHFHLLRTIAQRPLQIGSHCSGWCSEGLALENLNLPHQHAFASDKDPSVQTLLKMSFDIGLFFPNMMSQEAISFAPTVDIYVCGFPCQPWAYSASSIAD